MEKNEKEVRDKIANWLIYILDNTEISNTVFNKLLNNEYDNYVMGQTYEYRLKKKDEEIRFLEQTHNFRFDFSDKKIQDVEVQDVVVKTIKKQVCDEIKEKIYALAFNENKQDVAEFSMALMDYINNVILKEME